MEEAEIFVGLDVAKLKHAVANAEEGRSGEVRFFGEINADTLSVRRMVAKLEKHSKRLHFCYEAGPTGYGLFRQLTAMGHQCSVIAPSLIPRCAGDRVKTNRRDAIQLAKLLRAGELPPIWVPDEVHEAIRELGRARAAVVGDLRRKRREWKNSGQNASGPGRSRLSAIWGRSWNGCSSSRQKAGGETWRRSRSARLTGASSG